MGRYPSMGALPSVIKIPEVDAGAINGPNLGRDDR